MDAIQRDKVTMYTAAQHVFKKFNTELSVIPALSTAINEFEEILTAINNISMVQQGRSDGATKLKVREEEEMIQTTIHVAAAIYVYAHNTKQPHLKDKVKVSPTSLSRMRDKDLKLTCLNIYKLAYQVHDELGDYGISPEMVTKLKKDIDNFETIIASPNGEIVTRAQATSKLIELFALADNLLKIKIDRLMVLLETAQPKAYKTYLAARIIADLKDTKTTQKETIEA